MTQLTWSLPTRERGSKQSEFVREPREVASLPTRERGSKHQRVQLRRCEIGRSPRGSADRNLSAASRLTRPSVAPHAGARIETRPARPTCPPARVAPHAGARIET